MLNKVLFSRGVLTVSWFIKILKSKHPLTLWLSDSINSSPRSSIKTPGRERPSFRSLHKSDYLRNTASTQRESLLKSACQESKAIDARRYDAFLSSVDYDFDDSKDDFGGLNYDFYDIYRGGRSVERKNKYKEGRQE